MNLVKKDLDEYFSSKPGPIQRHVVGQKDGKTVSPLYSNDVTNAYKVQSNMEGERILVEFPGVSFFDSGNHSLTKAGQEALSDFAMAVNKHLGSFRLVVRGYTDGSPLKSKVRYKDNLELSAFRSISAIRFLHDQGLSLKNMRIAGYGESSLSRIGKDRDLASLQRKVVLVIEPLDHTEQGEEAVDGAGAGTQTIEDAQIAKVKEREISSVKPQSILSATREVIVGIRKETEKVGQAFVTEVNTRLGESMILQRVVDQTVVNELQKKGYSKEQAEKMLKNYNQKEKRIKR